MIKKEKLKNLEIILFGIANVVLYMFTRSRTGFLVVMVMIILLVFIRNIRASVTRWCLLVASLITLLSVVFLTIHSSIYNIDNSYIMNKLDPLLNGRLQMVTEHANIKDWTWFPEARSSEYVDNGFSTVIYCYGIVIGLLLLILILILIHKQFVSRDNYMVVILISTILVLFMESTFIINVSLLCNVIIILAMESIANNGRLENAV